MVIQYSKCALISGQSQSIEFILLAGEIRFYQKKHLIDPIASMYGIFTYIYHKISQIWENKPHMID